MRGEAPFDNGVERALKEALKWSATTVEEREQRLKVLAISVKWCAVKAKLTTSEHGSGFEDEDEVGGL